MTAFFPIIGKIIILNIFIHITLQCNAIILTRNFSLTHIGDILLCCATYNTHQLVWNEK